MDLTIRDNTTDGRILLTRRYTTDGGYYGRNGGYLNGTILERDDGILDLNDTGQNGRILGQYLTERLDLDGTPLRKERWPKCRFCRQRDLGAFVTGELT